MLVTSPDEDRHPADLVEVIVCSIGDFAIIPSFSLHDDEWSATVECQ